MVFPRLCLAWALAVTLSIGAVFSSLSGPSVTLLALQFPADSGLCSPAPNVLTWSTASEVNTAGFNLYRSEGGDAYEKINAQLVATASDPLVGGQYRFEDANVVPGRTYLYELEDVDTSGHASRHGPIVVTARSNLGLCENPALAVGLVLLAVLAVGIGVLLGRRRKERPTR